MPAQKHGSQVLLVELSGAERGCAATRHAFDCAAETVRFVQASITGRMLCCAEQCVTEKRLA